MSNINSYLISGFPVLHVIICNKLCQTSTIYMSIYNEHHGTLADK